MRRIVDSNRSVKRPKIQVYRVLSDDIFYQKSQVKPTQPAITCSKLTIKTLEQDGIWPWLMKIQIEHWEVFHNGLFW